MTEFKAKLRTAFPNPDIHTTSQLSVLLTLTRTTSADPIQTRVVSESAPFPAEI